MIDLDEQIFGSSLSWKRFAETRVPCAIQSSQTPRQRPVDVVVADLHIDGGVELDARHLGAREQPADVDVVDGVAGDDAERRAQAADDARLLAMRDGVVADDVVADGLLVPAVLAGRARWS